MANSTKQPPKKGKLKQMPSQNGGVATAEPPKPAPNPPAEPATPFDPEIERHDAIAAETPPPSERRGPGRPKTPGRIDFFDRVASIPAADWGTTVFMYLYCYEPICDEKVAGEKKYLIRFTQPVRDEQEIMVDYGSGKYRLTLSGKKPPGQWGAPIETYDFEIYNMKYPPKIPREVWKNDPRNKRWEALLPKEPPAGPTPPAIDPLAAFNTYMNIQDRIEERIKPPAPPAPTAPPAPPDPFDTVAKIMQMRSNDPMIAALMQRLDASDKAQEAARQREFDLQKELRQQAQPHAAPAPPKGLPEQLLELLPVFEKFEALKKLFGSNGTSSDTGPVIQTKKLGAMELFLTETLPKLVDSPLANAAAAKWMSQSQQPGAAMNGAAPRPAVQQRDPFERFITETATPAMLQHFKDELSGEDFATWIDYGFPQWLEKLQQFQHPGIPGMIGAPAIITAYKNTPEVWPILAAKEAQFTQFISEFCAWKPPEDEAETVEANTVDDDGWQQRSGPDREEAPV